MSITTIRYEKDILKKDLSHMRKCLKDYADIKASKIKGYANIIHVSIGIKLIGNLQESIWNQKKIVEYLNIKAVQ